MDGLEGEQALRLLHFLQGIAHQAVHQEVAVPVFGDEALTGQPAPVEVSDPAHEGPGQGGHLPFGQLLGVGGEADQRQLRLAEVVLRVL
jgi:hypothetical protein